MANYAHDVCAKSHIFRGVLMKPPALLPYGRLPGAERTATISRIALPTGAVERNSNLHGIAHWVHITPPGIERGKCRYLDGPSAAEPGHTANTGQAAIAGRTAC